MDDQQKIKVLKQAIDHLLKGVNFALDENYTRKIVSKRLIESRSKAIQILKEASVEEKNAKS